MKGGRGYLLIDDRHSGGELIETPTLTCNHCNCVTYFVVKHRHSRRITDLPTCYRCQAYICGKPWCTDRCETTEEKIEQNLAGRPVLLGPGGQPLPSLKGD